ncbi:spondin domain-containing protein [Motilimonas pumila]|uniref:Spondin domain-containing protein n=1 Tax=Motilimonas pumila TaxID=2303987 RepID=A0A418YDI7_9GAMM|nr:spondin domain-containing protein [Motilimonas pumila]RJG42608.1 hypothetical protein D1Z90_12120 [Motilimonas pumila]
MKLSTISLLLGASMTSQLAFAQDIDIKVQNLSQGLYFTPLVIAAHNDSGYLFELGQSASGELQAMAEGGDISGLVNIANSIGANVIENPAAGLLAPAAHTSASVMTTDGNMYLSVSAMILPSNDGFVGLDRWPIPAAAGTYHIYLNAYDAGTEANNELVVDGSGAPGVLGIPAAPGMDAGSGGSGVTSTEQNTMVHVHRGNLGDDDLTSGHSDLDNTVHRWLNPVAKLTVTVK